MESGFMGSYIMTSSAGRQLSVVGDFIMTCSNCGNRTNDNAGFCSMCGSSLARQAPPSVPGPAQRAQAAAGKLLSNIVL